MKFNQKNIYKHRGVKLERGWGFSLMCEKSFRERVMKLKAQDSIVNQRQEQGNTYENKTTKVSEDYFTGDFNLDLEVIKKRSS
ncbi:hypothetical protein PDQ38_17285 [Bacillus cereus]|nr:hypothetical protein [Bacillus cereus]MDA2630953.1 hypothetical protein [Bacillus cereus]